MHENEIQQSGCNFLLCMSTMFSSLVGLNQEDIFCQKGDQQERLTQTVTHTDIFPKTATFLLCFCFFASANM